MGFYTNPFTGEFDNRGLRLSTLDARFVNVTGDTMTGTLQIDVATTTDEALILKTTDDNTTKNLFEAFKADGTTYLASLTADGKFGIGTGSPQSGLHYQGDILYLTPAAGAESNDNITIKNYATGNGAPNIILKTADISGAYGIGVGTLSLIGGSKTTHYGGIDGGGGKISLQGGQGRNAANNPSGYAPVLLQSTGGNVGIGTTEPGRNVEIYGSSSILRLRDSGATANATLAYIEFGGTDAAVWSRTGYIGDSSSGNVDIAVRAEVGDLHLGDSSGGNVMNLQSGNVGINETNPLAQLQINTSGAAVIGQIIKAAASQSANIQQNTDSDGNVLSGVDERGIPFADGNTASNNYFAGNNAGNNTATGNNNIGIGAGAGAMLTTGAGNTFFGTSVGDVMTEGLQNSLFGTQSGTRITTGDSNVGVGANTFFQLITGNQNTAIGVSAGLNVTGSRNVFIGYLAGSKQTTLSDLLIIDNRVRADIATELTNSILYGVMAATPASQTLRINAVTSIFGGGDIGDGTNKTVFEADGTLKMEGDATVFSDLQFPISFAKVPASNAPTWETFTPNTKEYGFAVDDFIDTQANETPHSWKHGTTGHIHMHITTKAANATGSDRFAKFTVLVAFNDTDETWQETSFTAELTIPTGTSALQMFYLDMGDLTLTDFVEEAEIKLRVTRIDATGGTEYLGNIFITQVGIHLLEDTLGSRTELSK